MRPEAGRWAMALLAQAPNEEKAQRFAWELEQVQKILKENPDFLRLLTEPSLRIQVRDELLVRCFSAVLEPEILNCLRLMCRWGQGRCIPDCAEAYVRLWDQRRGVVYLQVSSAVPLSRMEREQLHCVLEQRLGRRVRPVYECNPALLGGVRLEWDGHVVDASIKKRLQKAGQLLTGQKEEQAAWHGNQRKLQS